ncbi:MAG: hypothetical protein ACFFG0_09630 [Candidatus Thorarchaeota archaeon]
MAIKRSHEYEDTQSNSTQHNCFDCLNSIPPQQITDCINCFAERTNFDETLPIFLRTFFHQFIINKTFPLLFLGD